MHRLLLVLGSLLLRISIAVAQEVILVFDDTNVPPPATFLVTVLRATPPQEVVQFRLPNLGRSSCDAVVEPTLTPASVCGRPPECYAPGIYSFWINAERGEEMSPRSNIANCEILAGCRANCAGLELPPALQALLQPGADGTPPLLDDAALQRFMAYQSQALGAASASVEIPPATDADVLDQILPALRQLAPMT